MRTITGVIHGESGAGKSRLIDTMPAPRLILDAEGGSVHLRSRPVRWNPALYAPPGVQGCEPGQEQVPEATCVTIRDFAMLQRVYQWLDSGQHHFRSVGLDSLTEIQKRCKDALVGTAKMQTQDWGSLLDDMERLIRNYRDLATHPTRPFECVVFNALTSEGKGGKWRPHLQGQIVITLPGYVDVVGYLYVEQNGTSGALERKLLIQPVANFVAKDRTDDLTQAYGPVITSPNFEQMLAVLNNSGGQ